jgi:hypothetical protein
MTWLPSEHKTASPEGWPFCVGGGLLAYFLLPVSAQRNDLQIDTCQAGFGHSQLLRGSERKVDDAPFFYQVAAICDLDDDGLLVVGG